MNRGQKSKSRNLQLISVSNVGIARFPCDNTAFLFYLMPMCKATADLTCNRFTTGQICRTQPPISQPVRQRHTTTIIQTDGADDNAVWYNAAFKHFMQSLVNYHRL